MGNNQELIVPLVDIDDGTIYTAQSVSPYGSWALTSDIPYNGVAPAADFQDSQGHQHILFVNRANGHVS